MKFRNTKNWKLEITLGIVFILILSSVGVWGVTRTITDTSDTIDTYIKNSNGNWWEVTEANLQAAIDDIADGGGVVELPVCNITVTSEILIHSNIKLIGQGRNRTILYQQQFANTSLLMNAHWTNGYSFPSQYDENIWIEGITFDGNEFKQELWNRPTDYSQILHAIKLMAVKNVTITKCHFRDVSADGVNVRHGSDIHIDYNTFDGIGMNFSYANFDEEVTTRGAYFFYCDNSTFNFNVAKQLHCSAVAIEQGAGSGKTNIMENFEVIGNVIDSGWNGIWVEGGGSNDGLAIRNVVISNNVISNCTRPDGYQLTNIGQMNAIGCVRYTYNMTISNNVINEAGNRSNNDLGRGIWCTGENNTITGNTISKIWGIGILCSGSNIISNNVIINCSNYGIKINIPSTTPNLANPIITNNLIIDTNGGISLDHGLTRRDEVKGGVVSDNIIKDCMSYNGVYGIYARLYNITYSDNCIDGGQYGIYVRANNVLLLGNIISSTASDGIRIYDTGSTSGLIVSDNRINDCGGDAILMSGVTYSSFMGNVLSRCVDGIDETGADDYNIYIGNIVYACSGDDYDINGANCKPPTDNRSFFNIGTFA